jgi:hypothetical protein
MFSKVVSSKFLGHPLQPTPCFMQGQLGSPSPHVLGNLPHLFTYLFVLYLTTLSQYHGLLVCSVELKDERRKMNCKGYGRKRSWPNLRYYLVIFLERLSKTTKIPG